MSTRAVVGFIELPDARYVEQPEDVVRAADERLEKEVARLRGRVDLDSEEQQIWFDAFAQNSREKRPFLPFDPPLTLVGQLSRTYNSSERRYEIADGQEPIELDKCVFVWLEVFWTGTPERVLPIWNLFLAETRPMPSGYYLENEPAEGEVAIFRPFGPQALAGAFYVWQDGKKYDFRLTDSQMTDGLEPDFHYYVDASADPPTMYVLAERDGEEIVLSSEDAEFKTNPMPDIESAMIEKYASERTLEEEGE